MISARKGLHSQSETRANIESTVSMINELNAAKTFVSSVATMPTTIARPFEESHIQAVDLLKDQIAGRQQANRAKVLAIVDYVERMQTLDGYVSSVINSPLSSGDVGGTVAVFASALAEANDKAATLARLGAQCDKVLQKIAKAKLDIRNEHQRSIAADVAVDQERMQRVYQNRHLEEKKLR